MTRTIAELLLAAALAALAAPAAAAPVPPQPPGGRAPEYESAERLFLQAGSAQPFAEAVQRWQFQGQQPYEAVTLGTYARAARWLKVGAFYRVEHGARHDDDWDHDAAKHWRWNQTYLRPESSFILDATPRVQFPFLPGRNWVGSLKLRYEHNLFDGESLLRVEPELAWFWMNGLSPRATLFLRHEEAFPLNFGQTTVWQRWSYVGALWHPRPWLSLGPSIALRDEVWNTSAPYRSFLPAQSYRVLYRAWVAGFQLVVRGSFVD